MYTFDDRDRWFEQILHESIPDDDVRYSLIEEKLTEKIHECESQGMLALLRQDELCDDQIMDRVEYGLFSQISHHSEYDEPVNECVKNEYCLTDNQWERVAGKIEDRLLPVMQRPLWEQQLLASAQEPTLGYWEAFETRLFERINRAERKVVDSWEFFEMVDEPAVAASVEKSEAQLEWNISNVAKRPVWEQVLAADEIVAQSRWEKVEHNLFEQLEEKKNLPLKQQPFWFIVEHYTTLLKGVAVTGVVLLLGIVSSIGIKSYIIENRDIESIVYQAEGAGIQHYNEIEVVGSQCTTIPGGKMTLVNRHGFISLHDQSAITIDKMSLREAAYSVHFVSKKNSNTGDISFFVNKRPKRKRFFVVTPHYRIEVQGTYFKVETAPDGTVTTRVLEGVIRISDSPIGDTLLYSGEALVYDTVARTYRIYGGGETISREDIAGLPDVSLIRNYPVVTFLSSEPGATIHIEGKWQGLTPLKIRLPEGTYQARIIKDGFIPIDTMLWISAQVHNFSFACIEEQVKPVAQRKRVVRKRARVFAATELSYNDTLEVNEPVFPSKPFDMQGGSQTSQKSEMDVSEVSSTSYKYTPHIPLRQKEAEQSKPERQHIIQQQKQPIVAISSAYTMAQKAERKGKWRKAIALYRKVYDAPETTPLRREDALFSIGRMQADNIDNVEIAKQTFLTYVALFPNGSFAGECWLRLAELEFRKNQESAIHYYVKFFNQFPRHPRTAELRDRVGVIYLQQKQYHKAISMFEDALGSQRVSEALVHSIATHLHKALLENGNSGRAAVVRVKYQLSDK